MSYRIPFNIDESYHCYNRGVDKRRIFQDNNDRDRFLLLMYIGNGTGPIHISNLKNTTLADAIKNNPIQSGNALVEISAYSLMPNHFHFVLKEIKENGISTFMQKVFTAYTMYFNKKNDRTGALFAGPFKSKHVADDEYLKHLISYVHLNAAELFEPKWKQGVANVTQLEDHLLHYKFSSLPDFLNHHRLERKILGDSIFTCFDSIPSIEEMIEGAKAYYGEISRPRLDI